MWSVSKEQVRTLQIEQCIQSFKRHTEPLCESMLNSRAVWNMDLFGNAQRTVPMHKHQSTRAQQ